MKTKPAISTTTEQGSFVTSHLFNISNVEEHCVESVASAERSLCTPSAALCADTLSYFLHVKKISNKASVQKKVVRFLAETMRRTRSKSPLREPGHGVLSSFAIYSNWVKKFWYPRYNSKSQLKKIRKRLKFSSARSDCLLPTGVKLCNKDLYSVSQLWRTIA